MYMYTCIIYCITQTPLSLPLSLSLSLSLSPYRHLCVFVDAKAVYCTLAEILASEEKLSFASLMVRELNTILFSSAELFDLRMQLQNMDGPVSTGIHVEFTNIFKSFLYLFITVCISPHRIVGYCLRVFMTAGLTMP